jgi:DNA-binding MarR family transcriptional regulator
VPETSATAPTDSDVDIAVVDAVGDADGGPEVARLAELGDLAVRLARVVLRSGATHLAPLGVTYGQARLLRALSAKPLRMAEIAARMDVVPRSATDMVDGLQKAGLTARAADPGDRRSVLVTLTDEGEHLLRRLAAARQAAARDVFGRLRPDQRDDLHTLLGSLLTDADDADGAAPAD